MSTINYKDILTFLVSKKILCESNLPLETEIQGISSINNSNSSMITFFSDQKYIDYLSGTKALACLIEKKYSQYLPDNCFAIIINDPYIAFAHLTSLFNNDNITQNRFIKQTDNLFKSNLISPNATIYDDTIIMENTEISSNVVLGPNVKIGSSCRIFPNCSLSNCIIGNNTIIKSGSVIGQEGFGFTLNKKIKIYHIGNVIIGDNVNIGANTTIDRGTIDSTIIDNDVRLDNQIHIAHNVKIGKGTIIAAQTGIAGGTKIGSNCIMGGQVGITGHVDIGNNVTIAAKSGVTKSLPNNIIVAGFPAIDIKKWKRNIIRNNKL